MAKANPFVVVGIPAYNEERTIAQVILDAQRFADLVIVCDDGSTDQTRQISRKLGADVVAHEKNCGYGSTIKSLFQRASELNADVFVTIDADGQHEPNEIPAIIKPLLKGSADIVIGSRFVHKNGTAEMPLYRQFGAKLITTLVNGSAKNGVTDAQSGFRAYNRSALDRINFNESGMGASIEILLKASKTDLRITEVPSTCKYSTAGTETSSEHPLTHGVGVIMSLVRLIVEERPLVMLGIPSLIFLLAGTAFGLLTLQNYVMQHVLGTNLALATISFSLIGFFTISTAITLYAICRFLKNSLTNNLVS